MKILIPALAAVFVLTACGGQSAADPTASPTAQDAVAYSRCMRSHGVPGFPDPQAGGEFAVDGGELGVAMDSQVFTDAEAACAGLLPRLSDADRQKNYAASLEFAACVRQQGISGFPDPQPPGEGTQTEQRRAGEAGPSPAFDPASPQFRAANEACKHLLPEGDAGAVLNEGP